MEWGKKKVQWRGSLPTLIRANYTSTAPVQEVSALNVVIKQIAPLCVRVRVCVCVCVCVWKQMKDEETAVL